MRTNSGRCHRHSPSAPQSNGVGDANRTATRATRPGSSTPSRPSRRCVQIAIVHRPWVNTKSKPAARAAVDVEVVRRPVAGHLRVAMCHVLVDVLADGSERVGPRVFGEPVVGGHRSRDRRRRAGRAAPSSTTARRRPPRRRRPVRTAPRSGCPPEMSAPPRSATRYPAAHRGRAAGATRCRARRAPRRGRAATTASGRSALAASCGVKTRITGNTAGTASPSSTAAV